MADWTFYSPSRKFPSAGNLLRAVPTRRLIRMERVVVDGDEESLEAVRAAELLLNLDVTLRYQNDASGALRLVIAETSAATRRDYDELEVDGGPAADDIEVFARLSLTEEARAAGHADLADDVLAGLDRVFPGGVAHEQATGRTVMAEDIARVMDPEQTRYSHVDAQFVLDEPQYAFICEKFDEIDEPLRELVTMDDDRVRVRGRFPGRADASQIDALWSLALEAAAYARGGHVRFRTQGVWSEVVKGLGKSAAQSPPEEWLANRKRTVRGVLSRLLGRD